MDEGGFRRIVGFVIAADEAVGIRVNLADFFNAGAWGHIDAPVAMNAEIVVDAEFVMAEIAPCGSNRNALSGKALFHFGVVLGASGNIS